MTSLTVGIACVCSAVLLAACGAQESGAGWGGPDRPVSDDGRSDGGVSRRPRFATPTPGMLNVQPVTFSKLRARGDRTVIGRFYMGVEPCNLLERVEVRYGDRVVAVGAFVGAPPDSGDVACIEIAELRAVRITLEEPLRGRRLVDMNA